MAVFALTTAAWASPRVILRPFTSSGAALAFGLFLSVLSPSGNVHTDFNWLSL